VKVAPLSVVLKRNTLFMLAAAAQIVIELSAVLPTTVNLSPRR